jgi:hypothetical protein
VGRKAGELARTGGHYEDVYVKTPAGWRFKKRDFIPSTSGADPAPLAPWSIPADTTPIDTRAPLARKAGASRRAGSFRRGRDHRIRRRRRPRHQPHRLLERPPSPHLQQVTT